MFHTKEFFTKGSMTMLPVYLHTRKRLFSPMFTSGLVCLLFVKFTMCKAMKDDADEPLQHHLKRASSVPGPSATRYRNVTAREPPHPKKPQRGSESPPPLLGRGRDSRFRSAKTHGPTPRAPDGVMDPLRSQHTLAVAAVFRDGGRLNEVQLEALLGKYLYRQCTREGLRTSDTVFKLETEVLNPDGKWKYLETLKGCALFCGEEKPKPLSQTKTFELGILHSRGETRKPGCYEFWKFFQRVVRKELMKPKQTAQPDAENRHEAKLLVAEYMQFWQTFIQYVDTIYSQWESLSYEACINGASKEKTSLRNALTNLFGLLGRIGCVQLPPPPKRPGRTKVGKKEMLLDGFNAVANFCAGLNFLLMIPMAPGFGAVALLLSALQIGGLFTHHNIQGMLKALETKNSMRDDEFKEIWKEIKDFPCFLAAMYARAETYGLYKEESEQIRKIKVAIKKCPRLKAEFNLPWPESPKPLCVKGPRSAAPHANGVIAGGKPGPAQRLLKSRQGHSKEES